MEGRDEVGQEGIGGVVVRNIAAALGQGSWSSLVLYCCNTTIVEQIS